MPKQGTPYSGLLTGTVLSVWLSLHACHWIMAIFVVMGFNQSRSL